jgi:hypothetical protein
VRQLWQARSNRQASANTVKIKEHGE